MRPILLIALACLCIAPATKAETFPCSFGSGLPSFILSADPKCRASLEISNARICLSDALWKQWLIQPESAPICGSLSGDWKLSAPLSTEVSSLPKKIRSSFRLKSLPNRHPVSTLWKHLQWVRENLSQRLAPLDPWGVYRSMLLGERNSNGPLSFLRLIGFFHLFNASGVHLYAIALWIAWMTKRLFMSAQLPAHSAIKLSRLTAIAFWLWAWALCGCRIGLLRPALMVGAKQSSQSLGFRWRYWTPFVLSFVLELTCAIYHYKLEKLDNLSDAIFSEARLDVALAVGGFLLMLQTRRSDRFTHALAIIGGWIFVALAQAFHSQSISLFAPLLGFLSLPYFCSITYPWLLIESAFGTSTQIGDALIRGSLSFLNLLIAGTLKLPSFWIVPQASLILGLALGLIWIVWSFYHVGKTRFLVLVPIFLALLALRPQSEQSIAFEALAKDVIQLDVGQGDSALVLSQNVSHGSLIDAGSAHSLSDAQWIQAFSHENVTELDWIGLTHLDEDHEGGIERLSRLIPIRCIASSSQEVWSERGQRIARMLLSRGIRLESWENGCVPYPIYRPKSDSRKPRHGRASGNLNMSAVLIPLLSGDYYLSAGDAEGGDEVSIFKWADQNATGSGQRILKISHHGSNTSSDPQALKLFHPKYAVISAGLGNRYGHPAPEVMTRLSKLNIPVHRTDLMGPFRAGDVRHRPQERRP